MSKIMLAGSSGVGKTTLAKRIAELCGSVFISGSVSDLLPDTASIPHSEMLKQNKDDLMIQDYKILNLRNKLYRDHTDFVTDRSFLDSATYFVYKQADKIPQCEVEHFVMLCKQVLEIQCDKLIILDFTPKMFKNWVIEDNDKRITNNYFQMQISRIMLMILDTWGFVVDREIDTIPDQHSIKKYFCKTYLNEGATLGHIPNYLSNKPLEVLIIKEASKEYREALVKGFLSYDSLL